MNPDLLPPASLPAEILKSKEAISLYQIAVMALAVIGVLSVLGGVVLAFAGRQAPGEVWTLGSIAVGGLVALAAGTTKG